MSWRAVFSTLAPAGERGRLSTLIFHRVVPRPDPLFPGEIDAERFDRICGWVKNWFNVLPLDVAVQRLVEGTLPSRALAITFDDGYADNAIVALPILRRHGLTSTFFITTGFVSGGRMWNDTLVETIRGTALKHIELRGLDASGILAEADLQHLTVGEPGDWVGRRRALDALLPRVKYMEPRARQAFVDALAERAAVTPPFDLMMSVDQLRLLDRAGMTIGAHTVTHPILTRLPDDEARKEISESRQMLQEWLGHPACMFAYPNGKWGDDFDDRHVRMVADLGFTAACSTCWGVADRRANIFQLPRFTPWDLRRWRFPAHMASNMLRR